MIEWTICENCGKILDNGKKTCPFCQKPVKRYDITYLKDYISRLTFLVQTIDCTNPEILKNDFPLIYDWKAKNFTLESALIDDLLNWVFYLKDELSDRELEFINELFDSAYSKEDINSLNSKLPKLPKSFKFLHEQDEFKRRLEIDSIEYCECLYQVFNLTGKFFITVNGELEDDDLNKFKTYMAELRRQIDEYKSEPVLKIASDTSKPNKINDYLEELNHLVGLENVKKDVNSLINLVQIRKIRQERGIKQPAMSLHLVFSGNPGTGKTTVARILSKIYHEIGLLSKGHLIETDRSGLVGGYVGQTAIKTQEVISSAMGGILFIDEAYSLARSAENDYGSEAIDTILKAMEDKRDDLIVIVAGYPELMENFLHSNPGLESRFNKFIYFDDYDSEELYKIFKVMCDDSSLKITEEAEEYLKDYFRRLYEERSENFANGRAVRNLFENVLTAQANRLVKIEDLSDDELNTLTIEDFEGV